MSISRELRSAIIADMALPGAVAAEVGKKHGVSRDAAVKFAKEEGVFTPAKRGRKPDTDPNQDLIRFEDKYPGAIALFGKLPDAEIGRQLGISRERVRQMRERFGVTKAKYIHKNQFVLSAEQEALLGKVPDAAIAEQLGCSGTTIHVRRKARGVGACGHRSGLVPYLGMFGKILDVEIAKLANLTPRAIATYRQRHPDLPRSPRLKKQAA